MPSNDVLLVPRPCIPALLASGHRISWKAPTREDTSLGRECNASPELTFDFDCQRDIGIEGDTELARVIETDRESEINIDSESQLEREAQWPSQAY